MTSLYQHSIQIILEGQSASGAYIASPNFPTYHYSWLRDGSFIAHSMDAAGEYASAEAFFCWVGRTIQKYSYKVDNLRQQILAGLPVGKDDVLHTRFDLDGAEATVDESWGNFQIDGYGSWLWALVEHIRLSGKLTLLKDLEAPINTTLQYLELVWKLPNYDCWEEYPEYLNPYSLATVYGGFEAIASIAAEGGLNIDVGYLHALAAEVKDFILKYTVQDGHLVKHICPPNGSQSVQPALFKMVDSSLIGVALPYNVFPLDHPLLEATIQLIETDLLRPAGGVYRYKADVYYGGGEWLLLTAWLGWYYARVGKVEQAEALCHWIEAQVDENGFLAEQVSDHILSPDYYDEWEAKWGPIARPLLWSHAMYIILVHALQRGDS